MEKETWRPVVGYEGYYEVSDLGRVKRVANGGRLERVLRPALVHGYPYVGLCVNAKIRSKAVHVLVMRAFVGERPSGNHIDHIDGNRLNARLGNLEYVTPTENVRRALVRIPPSQRRKSEPRRRPSDFEPLSEEEKAWLRGTWKRRQQVRIGS